MLRYILFDFDGTLADSREVTIKAINQLADKHRFRRIEPENLKHLLSLPIRERAKLMDVPLYKLPFLVMELLPLYREGLQQVKLFPGIKETLTELKALGYSLAIISSNTVATIQTFLQQQNLPFIDEVICARNIFGKDYAIRKFLKARNLQPKQVMYVGDELRDVVACRKCNVPVAWASWGFDLSETLREEKPDFIVHAPADILEVVQTKATVPLMWAS
jgi:phosphoglycolate phosphatase